METKKIPNKKPERVALDFCGKTSLVEKRRWMERCIWKLLGMLRKRSPVILEAACTDGRDTEIFVQRGARVVSICSSQKQLEFARRRAPEAEYHLSDIDLKPEIFDAVWCIDKIDSLSHDDAAKIFTDSSCVLKPKGLLAFNSKGDVEIETLKAHFEILEREPCPEEFFEKGFYQVTARKR